MLPALRFLVGRVSVIQYIGFYYPSNFVKHQFEIGAQESSKSDPMPLDFEGASTIRVFLQKINITFEKCVKLLNTIVSS